MYKRQPYFISCKLYESLALLWIISLKIWKNYSDIGLHFLKTMEKQTLPLQLSQQSTGTTLEYYRNGQRYCMDLCCFYLITYFDDTSCFLLFLIEIQNIWSYSWCNKKNWNTGSMTDVETGCVQLTQCPQNYVTTTDWSQPHYSLCIIQHCEMCIRDRYFFVQYFYLLVIVVR